MGRRRSSCYGPDPANLSIIAANEPSAASLRAAHLEETLRGCCVGNPETTFRRLERDGEVHRDFLCLALELMGIIGPVRAWVDDVFATLSRYTTLDHQEFLNFFELYKERQDMEYGQVFMMFDSDGSGTIEATELWGLLARLGITPMDHVIAEILQEVDTDCSGELNLQEFCLVMELLGAREGFAQGEFERLMAAFQIYDVNFSSSLDACELSAVLSYLHYSVSREDVAALAAEVDVDHSGALNSREFLVFMRKVRECEVSRLQGMLTRLEEEGKAVSKESLLFGLLRGLGYFPDREAVLEAAEDAGLELPQDFEVLHICLPSIGLRASDDDAVTLDIRPSLEREPEEQEEDETMTGPRRLLDALSRVKQRSPDLRARHGQDGFGRGAKLGLGEAWRFVEVYRSREGLTRAEAADLQAAFERYACEGDKSKIGTLDAGRALKWLGYKATSQVEEQLMGEVDINSSGCLSITELQKLVRKFQERQLEDIRGVLLQLGLWRETGSMWFTAEEHASAMLALGCVGEDGDVQGRPGGTDLFGLVNDVLRFHREARNTFRLHSGFSPSEVAELRTVFDRYDSDRGGAISHADLRRLCEDFFPEQATSTRNRSELVGLLNRVNEGGDGVLNFDAFLRLMREFLENRKKEQRAKENRAISVCEFTASQVREFREIFIAADAEEQDCLSFKKVQQLIHRIAPLGDRRTDELTRIWQHVVTTGSWVADFADFLVLMKHLLDINFANIRHWSARRAP